MESAKKSRFSVRQLCLMAFLAGILFLQEELLTFLPNIQLTVFLILLYGKCLDFTSTLMIVTVYLLLDTAFMGSMHPIFTLAQWTGWLMNPLITCTLCKRIEEPLALAATAAGMAFLYSWIMIVPTAFLFGVSIKAYFLADLGFEILLAASSFLSTLLLYKPLAALLRKLRLQG